LVDNLSSRQLLANAEIRLQNNERLGVNYENLDNQYNISQIHTTREFSSIVEPFELSDKYKKWISTRIKSKSKPSWIKGADFDIEKTNVFPEPDYSIYQNMSIIDIFEKFIDDDIIQHFVVETKNYALFLNCPDPNIISNEIRCFLAILFVSGYNDLPSKRHYWDNGDDMKNIAVSQSMHRDRFLQICRFFHCTNNTEINLNDKGWKIRPFIEMMKKRCVENFVPEEHLAYDESMVKYFGRHSCKQFIRGKPIRFGYKIWCLNSKDGYLVNFDLYQGKNLKSNSDYEKLFGKAASPLLVLLDEIPDYKRELKYNIYMDNLFSSPALFSFLRFRGYSAIGTIRENRIPKNCPLTNKTIFKKKSRGYFETAVERKDGLLYLRWMDNAVVTMISSSCGSQNVGQVKRFSQKEKRNVLVPRPRLIAKYNMYMGGTDQMDQNIACYRVGIRGKKWYWPLITWMFDVALQNSWILFNKTRGTKINQLDFKREIVNVYLRRYQTMPKAIGRPSTSTFSTDCRVSDSIRFDKIDHMVKLTEDKKKKRCAGKNCKSIMRTMCSKCNVGLCVDCFIPFHSR
jgi:DNA excision repair protein ERCC-6